MAIIKCKMCGADIEPAADKTFGTCEFCGCSMTFPKIDDDQRAAAFNRGNHFRRIGEFDKALAVYERIVREDNTDAEAHWCCALCRFGIEYVEDPSTFEWLPTCHRASFDSFLEDVDYLAALEYSDGITRRQYQKDAAKIAEVQRGILATSQNEEPFDVFICYKESDEAGERTRDSLLAQDIYYQLTEQGRKVFFARITLEDMAGKQYEPYIFAALNSAKVMIVVGTKPEYMNAVWVKNEWSRFLAMMKKDRTKLLLPCYRDMDPYDMPEQLSVLQSYDMSKIGFIQDLTRGIAKVLDAEKKQPEQAKETVVVQQASGGNIQALLKRGNMALEDSEWTNADEFFEEVLNQDAECAEAYLGKALAMEKCQTLSQLAEKWLSRWTSAKKITLSLPENTERSRQAQERWTLPGYLEAKTIGALYPFQLTYPSTVADRQEQRKLGETTWNSHKLLTRAARFAQGNIKAQLDAAKSAYLAVLDARVTEAENQETAAREEVLTRYNAHIAQADADAEALFRDAFDRRHAIYESCKAYIEDPACTTFTLEQAETELVRIFDYLDSEELLCRCREKIQLLRQEQEREEAERERKEAEQHYLAAKNSIESATELWVLREKLSEFQALGNYRDSKELAALCQQKIDAIKESMEQQIAAAKADEDAKKKAANLAALEVFENDRKRKRTIQTIIVCSIIAVLVAVLLIFNVILPIKFYNEAEAYLSEGNVKMAAISYGKARNYKDAQEQSKTLWKTLVVHNTLCLEENAIFALKDNGTIVYTLADPSSYYNNWVNNVSFAGWKNIVSIASTSSMLVGLQEDGTLITAGRDTDDRSTIAKWSGIVDIASNGSTIYALRADGKIVSTSTHGISPKLPLRGVKDVVQLVDSSYNVGFLFADGRYGYMSNFKLITKPNEEAVMHWSGSSSTAFLCPDGSVTIKLSSSSNKLVFKNEDQLSNITAISGAYYYLVGLQNDGNVIAIGTEATSPSAEGWSDIVCLRSTDSYFAGLKADGTVVCTSYEGGFTNIKVWSDIRLP